MRRHRKRLYIYSLLWGAVSFAAGITTTIATMPQSLSLSGNASWKVSTWLWLSAHGVPISERVVTGQAFAVGDVNLAESTPELYFLRVLPLFLVVICSLVIVNAMRGARTDAQLLKYVTAAAGGYTVAGLVAIVWSKAQPAVGWIVGILLILGTAAYLGGMIAQRLPVPVFAITSIGGLLGIGLLALFGVGAVVAVALPLAKYAAAGAASAFLTVWISTNLDY